MTNAEIAHQRLHTQHRAGTPLPTPEAVVGWLGAVQAQDYPAAQWALGLRLAGGRDADINQAGRGPDLADAPYAPDLAFVTPADSRRRIDEAEAKTLDPQGTIYFGHMIVMDGRMVGAGKRTLRKGAVVITPQTYRPFTAAERQAFATAAGRYGAFLGLPVVLA